MFDCPAALRANQSTEPVRTLLDRAVLASVLATSVMSLTALAIELHALAALA